MYIQSNLYIKIVLVAIEFTTSSQPLYIICNIAGEPHWPFIYIIQKYTFRHRKIFLHNKEIHYDDGKGILPFSLILIFVQRKILFKLSLFSNTTFQFFHLKPGNYHVINKGNMEGFHTDKESLINSNFDNEDDVVGDKDSRNQEKQKPSGRVSHKMACRR